MPLQQIYNNLVPQGASTGTIGTASSSLIAANTSRRGLIITNLSDNYIYLGIGEAATTSKPYVLVPKIGNAQFGIGDWGVDKQIFAIADTGASNTVAYEEYQ